MSLVLNPPSNPILLVENPTRLARHYSLQTHHKAYFSIVTSKSMVRNTKGCRHKDSPRRNMVSLKDITKAGSLVVQPMTKASTKAYNMIQSYSVGTHHGLHYSVNEDNTNIRLGTKSVFSLFDGYNGPFASSFLKNHFNDKAVWGTNTKSTVDKRIHDLFQHSEEELLREQKKRKDMSGSSALVAVFEKSTLHVANCGTSLAFGHTTTHRLIHLNTVHNCDNPEEKDRIVKEKGTFSQLRVELSEGQGLVQGPLRVQPCKILQTRTMGYPLAKYDNLIISKPEIKYIKTSNLKWVCFCTSGILTVLTAEEMARIINQEIESTDKTSYVCADRCVKKVMEQAIIRKCMSNMTVVVVIVGQEIKQKEPKPHQKTILNRSTTSTEASVVGLSFSREPHHQFTYGPIK